MGENMTGPNEQPGSDPETKWGDWYWKQVERVQEDISSGTDSFDKGMLTLSSGALGVSLAVIKDIVPLGQAVWVCLLLLSWIAFALCIVATVISFPCSIAAQKRHRDLLDRMYETKNRDLGKKESSGWKTAVSFCAHSALVLFLLGLFCTIIFVVVNVGKYRGDREGQRRDVPAVTNIRNLYMGNEGQFVEKVVKPQQSLEKGRQPMKLVPPPKPPANPAPCQDKK